MIFTLDVAVACPLPQTFSYLSAEPLPAGVRVLVPFGKRELIGVVIGVQAQALGEGVKLKSIKQVLDGEPIYSPVLLRLGEWMSNYYHHPIGEVFKAMLPLGNHKVKKESLSLTPLGLAVKADAQHPQHSQMKTLFPRKDKLAGATVRLHGRKLISAEGGSREEGDALIAGFLAAGLLQADSEASMSWRQTTAGVPAEGNPLEAGSKAIKNKKKSQKSAKAQSGLLAPSLMSAPLLLPPLTAEQLAAVATISELGLAVAGTAVSKPMLLFGVTGSGKTEIYLRLIAALRDGNGAMAPQESAQTLVLVPEISLTPQMTRVFEQRFPGQVAVVHSALSEGERWRQLERIRSGQAHILIGPRSAVFGPFNCLRLLIVDEEHDSSYKQTSQLPYHGRDIAVLRGKFEKACVVLGSATPSLESYWNATSERYHLIELKQRVHLQAMPVMQVIAKKPGRYGVELTKVHLSSRGAASGGNEDERQELPIAHEIVTVLTKVLERGEQAMVIVNRRGYAYYLIDLETKETVVCPHCSISLTLHLTKGLLRCHYCDYEVPVARIQAAQPKARFFAVGHGSQKVEHALQAALPRARIARLDSDVVAKRETLTDVLGAFREGTIDLLVGTQILAKGHDFPRVTLIAMLELDQLLDLPDFRAGERTFQLMVQAAGRAGRAHQRGEVLVQTMRGDHPVVQTGLNHDYKGFAERELDFRRAHDYPPFGRLVVIEFTGPHENQLAESSQKVEDWLRRASRERRDLFVGLKVLGPATPSIERIRQRYRRTLILASPSAQRLHRFVREFKRDFSRFPVGIRMAIDVDPQSML